MSAIKMKWVLTTPALIAYMVPLGIFTTYGEVTVVTNGHLPTAYIITLAMIFFTALSYCRIANKLRIAGSAYTYVQRTFGRKVSFFSWLGTNSWLPIFINIKLFGFRNISIWTLWEYSRLYICISIDYGGQYIKLSWDQVNLLGQYHF